MNIQAEVEFGVPCATLSAEDIQSWASATLSSIYQNAELCVRIVDKAEMTELNQSFRQKNQPTNVLSFPANLPEQPDLSILGDIAICAEVVEREATHQSKDPKAHWAHMVVHGCLHLAGHDHIEDAEAEEMEALETKILSSLGFPDPYHAESEAPIDSISACN